MALVFVYPPHAGRQHAVEYTVTDFSVSEKYDPIRLNVDKLEVAHINPAYAEAAKKGTNPKGIPKWDYFDLHTFIIDENIVPDDTAAKNFVAKFYETANAILQNPILQSNLEYAVDYYQESRHIPPPAQAPKDWVNTWYEQSFQYENKKVTIYLFPKYVDFQGYAPAWRKGSFQIEEVIGIKHEKQFQTIRWTEVVAANDA
jgi:hypothetical protein